MAIEHFTLVTNVGCDEANAHGDDYKSVEAKEHLCIQKGMPLYQVRRSSSI